MSRTSSLKASGTAGVLVSALAAAMPAQAQETLNIPFITGYAPSFSWTKAFVEHFVPEVDKKLASGGHYKINLNLAHSGTVVNPPGALEGRPTGPGHIGMGVTAVHRALYRLNTPLLVTPFTPWRHH